MLRRIRTSRGGRTYFAERVLQRTLLVVVLVAPAQESRDTVHGWLLEKGAPIQQGQGSLVEYAAGGGVQAAMTMPRLGSRWAERHSGRPK